MQYSKIVKNQNVFFSGASYYCTTPNTIEHQDKVGAKAFYSSTVLPRTVCLNWLQVKKDYERALVLPNDVPLARFEIMEPRQFRYPTFWYPLILVYHLLQKITEVTAGLRRHVF